MTPLLYKSKAETIHSPRLYPVVYPAKTAARMKVGTTCPVIESKVICSGRRTPRKLTIADSRSTISS